MKNIIVFIMGVVFFVISGCAQRVDIEVEKENVKAVLDQLIQASETEDVELLSKIYSKDADMVNFGTAATERIVGWDKLKELMEEQFAATENSKLSVKNQVIKVHNSGKVAWFSEIIDWSLLAQDQEVKLEGLRATGVLEKQNENWVIVQLHYSVPEAVKAEQE